MTPTRCGVRYVPQLKASLYAAGMTHLFVLEIAPLLTALLLAGRIGGSYAGEVGTMQATNQNRLLRTLGVSPVRWSLLPTVLAALLTAPLLTALGALVALAVGGVVFAHYELGSAEFFWRRVRAVVFAASESGEWANYAPFVLLYRSVTFMLIIVAVAELCARHNERLQPRSVPFVITSAVVLSGLLIIFADWGVSQVLIRTGLATHGIEVE